MRRVRMVLIVILVLLLAALVPLMVVAQEAKPEDSVLIPLLKQLLVPGVLGAVVGIVLSYLVELIPSYEDLGAKAKRLVFFLIAMALSIGAGVAIPLLAGDPLAWDPIIGNAIVASLAAWSGGTLAHTRQLPS